MADIDKDSPGDSALISQYPQNERDSRSAIETILAVDHEAGSDTADDGKHTIIQLLAQTTVSGVAGQGALYTKDVGSGVIELFYKDEAGNEIQLTAGNGGDIESGTNMLFNQASAPTGWTQDNSVNDRVIRVVDNTGTGASNGGSWTISGVTVDSHALTINEIPPHDHSYSKTENDGTGGDYDSDAGGDASASNYTRNTGNTGGGDGHSHGLTSDGTWRPAHRDVIAATKD